jgi:hypothetical protein
VACPAGRQGLPRESRVWDMENTICFTLSGKKVLCARHNSQCSGCAGKDTLRKGFKLKDSVNDFIILFR